MAVCNLFKELSNNTGNFLMFSQYSEDLTENFLKPNSYHITPSKFIVLNIDYTGYNNTSLPRFFQNVFENECAYLRSLGNWYPWKSREIFWGCMARGGFMTPSNSKSEQIVYIGDINMQSYDAYNGMGYSEIYCYIPNNASRGTYSFQGTGTAVQINYPNKYIMGYDAYDNVPLGAELGNNEKTYNDGVFYSFNNFLDLSKPEKSFEFNTIVVLYNIVDSAGEVISLGNNTLQDIPLGIYFTGTITNGIISNKVTKYVSNDDIFGAGTSYGLRICSRFSSQARGSEIVSVNSDGSSAGLSEALSEMSETITKMNEVVNNIHLSQSYIKEALSIFKNNTTNVPYIKKVGGADYWFVNGKLIGSAAGVDAADDSYVDQIIDDYDETLLKN